MVMVLCTLNGMLVELIMVIYSMGVLVMYPHGWSSGIAPQLVNGGGHQWVCSCMPTRQDRVLS